jgi:cell wall-associated NlpC family hydrolase
MQLSWRNKVKVAALCVGLSFLNHKANAQASGFSELLSPKAAAQHPASTRALDMLGARYVWGGESATLGMDCSGFVYRSYLDAWGSTLPRVARDMARKLPPVMPHQMRSGDLVFFNTRGARYSHVGIYLGGGLFAHAPRTGSPARLDMLSGYWLAAFDGARRPAPKAPQPVLASSKGRALKSATQTAAR